MRYESKKRICIALCGALAFSLSGCSRAGAYGRELEETVLVQVLGVDAWAGGITLTAAGTGGDGQTTVETVSAGSLKGAFAALPSAGEKYLSLTNVSHVIVGDGVDLEEVLKYVLKDRDMSYRARVWAASGFAGTLIQAAEGGGISRLSVLEQSVQTSTVKSALAELSEGKAAALPALTVKEGRLELTGTLYIEVR